MSNRSSLRIALAIGLVGCGSSAPPVQGEPIAPAYEIEEGSRVLVVWDATARLWPATVLAVHPGVAFVRFEDGSEAYIGVGNIAGPAPEAGGATTSPEDDTTVADPDPPPISGPLVLYDVRDRLVPARAIRCNDGVVVVFGDGQTAQVPFADVVTDPIASGDAVHARYQGGTTEYPGTIALVDGDVARVIYEDQSEETLALAYIASVLRPSRTASTTGRLPLCRELRGTAVPWVLVRRGRMATIGARESCEQPSPAFRATLAPGMAAYATWSGTEYAATITSVGDGTVEVEWYDGTTAELPTSDLRRVVLEDAALEPATCEE